MTNSQPPKISVGMPVHNGEKYLEASIACVLGQSFSDFELLISDNESGDATEEICRGFAAKDSRIKYSRNPKNLGAAANFNLVFEHATADYFRWHNADDLIDPDYHELCYNTLSQRPDAALVFGKTVLIDADGVTIDTYDDNLDLQQERPSERFAAFYDQVGLCNVIYGLMRRSALAKGPLFGDAFQAADIRFMGNLALHGKFVGMPGGIFYRRIHDESASGNKNEAAVRQFWNAGKKGFKREFLRLSLENFQVFSKMDIPFSEKTALWRYWLGRMYASKRTVLREIIGIE